MKNQKAEEKKQSSPEPKVIKKRKRQKQNDYGQHFVDTGLRPGNYIRDVKEEIRFIDYPNLNELIDRKNNLLKQRNHPAMCVKANIKKYDLTQLGKFDVILIDPPWKEYYTRIENITQYVNQKHFLPWNLDEIAKIPMQQLAMTPTFLFLWCGSEHLLDARTLFNKWGYKRCEDIVWVKSNKVNKTCTKNTNESSIFQKITEHCLVGLTGDVKRASDQHFIHANIDTDVIIDEESPLGNTKKPEEIYRIIERFCLGRRRLQLFGDNSNLRPGWVTVGENILESNFNKNDYERWFQGDITDLSSYQGGKFIGTTKEIEELRPKSPGRKNKPQKLYPKQFIAQQPYPYQQLGRPQNRNIPPNTLQGQNPQQMQQIPQQILRPPHQQFQQPPNPQRLIQNQMQPQQQLRIQQQGLQNHIQKQQQQGQFNK